MSGEVGIGRLARLRMLQPLAQRDFALLWGGMTLSLVGDGVYIVAVAWEVYSLSNAPTALSLVGVAWMLPQVPLFVAGGLATDRFDRRRVLIAADAMRGVAVGAIGLLAVTGQLELWHVVALVVLLGCGDALFGPAFSAIVPELVPRAQLTQANALDQFVRTATGRLVGPAIGGVVVAVLGAGEGFLFDAATFGASALAIVLIRTRSEARHARGPASLGAELREGLAYVRSQSWIWGTLMVSGVALLAFYGPVQVLLPFIVKNHFGGGAGDFGLVLAAGGAGSMLSALAWGQIGLPHRSVLVMLLAWAVEGVELIGLGLVNSVWQAAVVTAVGSALTLPGMIIWMTLLQSYVPARLLGRVSSIDWLVSTGLIPLSFAFAGPAAKLLGAGTVLVVAGAIASTVTLALLALPGVREVEKRQPG